MFNKILHFFLVKIMKRKGYSAYFSSKIVNEFIDDFKNNKDVKLSAKIWAYKKGFFSKSIRNYNLTEQNYHDYIADFDYYKLHPINKQFSKWIDDKVTMKYILSPFKDYLPEYYFELYRGKVHCLMDYDKRIKNPEVDLVLELLKEKGDLALKLIKGSKGIGFYKISYKDNEFLINNKIVAHEEFKKFIKELNGYLVTEYLVAHSEIQKIYSQTPNALRVGVYRHDNEVNLFGAFIRYGTKKTGMIDHAIVGGVFCGIDLDNGEQYNPKIYRNKEIVDCPTHPDSNVEINGKIPHWVEIKSILKEISDYVPQIKYAGYDIVVTEKGFKILEINSHQSLVNMQVFYPLNKNKQLIKMFEESI